jgi:hypothetical protein
MFSRFVALDRKFVGTWQERLMKGCIAAYEDNDWKAFTQAIYDQDKIHHLDDMSTKILLEIKKILKSERPVDGDAEEVAAELQ